MVLGQVGPDWRKEVDLTAGKRPTPLPDRHRGWLERVAPEGAAAERAPVGAATWVESSHRRGVEEGRQRLLDLVHCALLFRDTLDENIAQALHALATEPIDASSGHPKYGRDRFGDASLPPPERSPTLPLDELLEFGVSHGLVNAVFANRSALSRRLLVAARWHARALQASSPADGVLAAWTAFDALLGDGSATPDKAIANRFAVLGRTREDVQTNYAWLVGHLRETRMAATHGGEAARLEDFALVGEAVSHLRGAASRVWELLLASGSARDDDYGTLFRDLKSSLAPSRLRPPDAGPS